MAERFARLANGISGEDHWKPVTAAVIDSTYHYARLRDLNAEDYQDHSFFIIRFSYVVGNKTFEDKFEQWEPLEPGYEMEIVYNPNDTSQNSLRKLKHGVVYWLLVGIIGLCVVLFLVFLDDHLQVPPGLDF